LRPDEVGARRAARGAGGLTPRRPASARRVSGWQRPASGPRVGRVLEKRGTDELLENTRWTDARTDLARTGVALRRGGPRPPDRTTHRRGRPRHVDRRLRLRPAPLQ